MLTKEEPLLVFSPLPMPLDPGCLNGRIMKCLTFFLLLPETLKKSKKSARANSKVQACYEIVPLALKRKMAAELYPASANTNIANSNNAAAVTAKKNALQIQQNAPPPPQLQNLNNNNIESTNWQSFHPTLRERVTQSHECEYGRGSSGLFCAHNEVVNSLPAKYICIYFPFRNALMFNNELMADVHFIVGPVGACKKVPAHKYILAVGSSVFYAMFYGDLAEVKSEIHIPDVEPAAFLILLKYLYSDEIDLEADTVLATLYAAKKYIVPALAKACVNFLETSLEAKNACVLLSQSRLFEEPDLTLRCWEVIDAQAELALKSEGFCEIDLPTLEIIVTRETLNTKEDVVFEAVFELGRGRVQTTRPDGDSYKQEECTGKSTVLGTDSHHDFRGICQWGCPVRHFNLGGDAQHILVVHCC
ncbi:unnamed protein product [Ranitomeya imitator]|uniref:BTB domain-containing protein n=1 Tax=Ranitomeya imitator TaxID=111125 RepID=A0ABN9LJS1_9NEOB|nr:unnamed protein product [Ranitomeya imitator]